MGLLGNLPSRGLLTKVSPGASLLSRPASYLCTHDTTPPESQVIRQGEDDQLSRHYSSKTAAAAKAAAAAKPSGSAAGPSAKRAGAGLEASGSKKSAVDKSSAGPSTAAPAPAAAAGPSSGPSGKPRPTYTATQLKALTVKELADILRGLRLSATGRKDELVRRILDFQMRQKRAASGL